MHRPTVAEALKTLIAKRKLDCDRAIEKVKSMFRKKPKSEKRQPGGADFCSSTGGVGGGNSWTDQNQDADSSPECLDHSVPLTCPITRQLIRYYCKNLKI